MIRLIFKSFNVFPIFAMVAISVISPASALEAGPFELSGYFLGTHYRIEQENRGPNNAERTKFDFAANLGASWRMHPKVRGTALFLTGADDGGAGQIGLTGRAFNNFELSDLYLEIDALEKPKTTVTVGNFGAPFGREVARMSVNADISSNPCVLNSLFQSSYPGSMLGVQGRMEKDWWDLSLAVANGTAATAANADGNYAFIGQFGATPWDQLHLAVSYMTSDDTEPSGNSGFAADFSGWILDAEWTITPRSHLYGYVGSMDYGDENPATCDKTSIWMIEGKYGEPEKWFAALRFSGWSPKDRDGSGAGMSAALPNPGVATTMSGIAPRRDQRVVRAQVSGEYRFFENLALRAEYFRDDYDHLSGGQPTDVDGFILALHGGF